MKSRAKKAPVRRRTVKSKRCAVKSKRRAPAMSSRFSKAARRKAAGRLAKKILRAHPGVKWASKEIGRISKDWVNARFDAAETTFENRRHWQNADGLSADAALTHEKRRITRNRARYEVENSCYIKGIISKIALHTIGTGPRLHLTSDDEATNRIVEKKFCEWMTATGAVEKFFTMVHAEIVDGETFALKFTNQSLPHPVKLDFRLYEADQVSTPYIQNFSDPKQIDGMVLDDYGNPETFHLLKSHPGDTLHFYHALEKDDIPAKAMIHYFKSTRAGQHRGVTHLVAALPLVAQLRRWTQAVLRAAELAACLTILLQTKNPQVPMEELLVPGVESEVCLPQPWSSMEFERGMITQLPDGQEAKQLDPTQPSATHDAFEKSLLNQICASLDLPFGIGASNASGYNFSSIKYDDRTFFSRKIRFDRKRFGRSVFDNLFNDWFEEGVRVTGYLPQAARLNTFDRSHEWHMDTPLPIDEVKSSEAQTTRLENGTSNLAMECSDGDWRAITLQRVKERAYRQKLEKDFGLTPEVKPPAKKSKKPVPVGGGDDQEDGEDAQSQE